MPVIRGCIGLLIGMLVADGSVQAEGDGAIARLIARLGSESFEEREAATVELDLIGEPALNSLRRAAKSTDPEVRQRVQRILERIADRYRDASQFAAVILEATALLQEKGVGKPAQRDMVAHVVCDLFERFDEPVPSALGKRPEHIADLNEEGLRAWLREAYAWQRRLGPLDPIETSDRAMEHLLPRIDPYSRWITEPVRFQTGQEGVKLGAGLELGREKGTERIRVITPIKDGPAYKAGIRADDILTHLKFPIEGSDLFSELPTKGLPVEKVNELLRGERGTAIRLVIRRDGEPKPREVDLVRDRVKIESVLGYRRGTDENWDYWLDPKRKIGYVRVHMFRHDTADYFEHVLIRLNDAGMKGLVLDLRCNPGYLFDTGIKLAAPFLKDGKIVTVHTRTSDAIPFQVPPETPLRMNGPVVCLINGDTSGAPEFVAAALQDHHRAAIFGERSHGKGSFQVIQRLRDRELMLSTGIFLRPNGRKIDRMFIPGHEADEWGVSPDAGHEVRLTEQERGDLAEHLQHIAAIYPLGKRPADTFKDRQLEAAVAWLRSRL